MNREVAVIIGLSALLLVDIIRVWNLVPKAPRPKRIKPVNNEWLDVAENGVLVEINSKGKTRRKKRRN